MESQEIAPSTIKRYYNAYPELFPKGMEAGYMLNGKTRISKKLGIQMRKIKVSSISYRIRPSFVLPYFRAKTKDVRAGLFLLKFGVPFWALSYVFGKNAMWWYRLYLSFDSYSIVGTTVRDKANLTLDLLADEHHIGFRNHRNPL